MLIERARPRILICRCQQIMVASAYFARLSFTLRTFICQFISSFEVVGAHVHPSGLCRFGRRLPHRQCQTSFSDQLSDLLDTLETFSASLFVGDFNLHVNDMTDAD
jgi:hypothetical protein